MAIEAAESRSLSVAFSRFGKDRHAAGLKFGDCFSYALARALGERLLCKGGDFPLTDVALYEAPPA